MADGQREFLHGVIEAYQTRTSTHLTIAAEKSASTGVQQNEDMRRITAWVAIVAVPTAVTGFFGQNVPYPGAETTGGFLASTRIIIIFAAALFIIFQTQRMAVTTGAEGRKHRARFRSAPTRKHPPSGVQDHDLPCELERREPNSMQSIPMNGRSWGSPLRIGRPRATLPADRFGPTVWII
jgi:hypothetical protein